MNRSHKHSILAIGLAALAIVTAVLFACGHHREGLAMATLPLFGVPVRKMDSDPDPLGGGMGAQILARVAEVKQQTNSIETNLATTDREGKSLQEAFAAHVKAFEGMPGQIADVNKTIAKIQLKVAQERLSSHGSAIQRISGDEQMRNAINGVIRRAASNGGQRSIAITDDQKKGADDFARALSTGSTPGAGYVDDELIPAIYSLIAEYGIWRDFDVIPVSSNAAKMIVDTSDPDMLWIDENTEPSEASYTGGNVTATIKKMLGFIGISNELLADSKVDLSRYLLPKFANATARRLDWSCLSADGTADTTDGGHTGIFFGGTAAVAATGNVSVATLDLEDFLATMLAVNAAALSKQCYWWIHPQQLIRMLAIKDGNGRPIFLPAIDAPAPGAIGSILGYPVKLSHAAPNANTTSSKIAAFGDPMGEGVCLRSDFEFAASDQVKFTEDKTIFRARARAAAKVKQATAFGVLTTAAS